MAAYTNGFTDGNAVMLLHRDKAGELRAKRLQGEHVCYLRTQDVPDPLQRQLRDSQYVRTLQAEGDWLRVTWRDWDARKAACGLRGFFEERNIPTYEGDVTPSRRYAADHGVQVAQPRGVYLDIETDSRVPFSRKEETRVLCWTLVDEDSQVVATGMLEEDSDQDEARLIGELFAALDPFDQVRSWNGDGFDFVVVLARRKALRVKTKDPRRWLWLDHMVLFKKMNMHSAESGEEKQSMALQAIAMAVLGRGKADFNAKFTWAAWAAGGPQRAALLDYNIEDTKLMADIEKETGYIALFQSVCVACNIFPDSYALNPTAQVDGFMLRLGTEHGYHFATKHHYEEGQQQEEQFKGAFVLPPQEQGILRGVHVCDFSAMYPSIILTWNMSPETKARNMPVNGPIPEGYCRAPSTRIGFSTTKQGILTIALREIMRLRKHWNDLKATFPPGTKEWQAADRMSTAYKVIANSFYGVVGSPFSRYYDRQIAESTTQNGVWLIKLVMDHAFKRHGIRTVYGDTDSAYMLNTEEETFRAFVKWCNEELFPQEVAATGCVENHIKLAYEKEFSKLIMVSAKRYVGWYAHYKGKRATADSKPEIKGLEWKRGDTLLLARTLQGDTIDLLRDCEDPVRFEALARGVMNRVLHEAMPVEQVLVSKSLSKPLKDYVVRVKNDGTEGSPLPHIAVAKMLKERGEDVSPGTRIRYVVTDATSSPTSVIPADDYTGEFDRYYLWESLVWPPTYRLLCAAFPLELVRWDAMSKVRPKKPRGGKLHQALHAPDSPQVGLALGLPGPGPAKAPQVPATATLHVPVHPSHLEPGATLGPPLRKRSQVVAPQTGLRLGDDPKALVNVLADNDTTLAVPMRTRGSTEYLLRLDARDPSPQQLVKDVISQVAIAVNAHPGPRLFKLQLELTTGDANWVATLFTAGRVDVDPRNKGVAVTPAFLAAIAQAKRPLDEWWEEHGPAA